jgi:hypothetical protein
MSATQDKSQKTTFVYSNLYQLYKKGQDAAQKAAVPSSHSTAHSPAQTPKVDASPFAVPSSRNVLKAEDLNSVKTQAKTQAEKIQVQVTEYTPSSLIGKRVNKPEVVSSNAALKDLKQNLKNLNDLHARLRFMLQELEELAKG